ncbi:MAG: Crp/Fnr family transcriptional regulator [Rhodocyclaceae bacterium]
MGENRVTVATLRSFSMFNGMPEEALEGITRQAMMRRVVRNTCVIRAADRIDFVYLVLAGTLKVLANDEHGREVIFGVLGPGELFGEMGVLDDNPRSATVVAMSHCQLVVMGKTDFRRFLLDNADVSYYIMRNLVQRLRRADRKIESLALMDVYGRVARLLLEMAETINGEQVVTRKIPKVDIAKMVGASREMVSRVMTDLQNRGLIEEGGGRIVLHESIVM